MRGKFGMMKPFKLFILFFSFFFVSCEKDKLINDCSLPYPDLLCKTYLFENDICIGYINYDYNTALQKTSEEYKTINGKTEKSICFKYNQQELLLEERIIKNNKTDNEVISYEYTAFQKVEKKEYFKNENLVKSIHYFYDNTDKIEQIKIFNQSSLDSLIVFEYDNEGLLWRQSYFDKDNTLLSYEIHQFYDNNIERIIFYNAKDLIQGFHLLQRDAEEKMLSQKVYDRNNELVEKTVYEYENTFLIKVSKLDAYDKVKSYTVYFYS